MNSDEFKSLYASGLKKLIFENENSINALAHLAAEYQSYAAEVVSTIEEYIAKVDAKIKLCMLDLISCIIQKVGGAYVELFSENISILFCNIFKAVDSDSRIKMYNLRQIWTDIFPAEKLYEIDFKANLLDPTWPTTAQNPYLVHVNPKCLPQYSLLRIQDELLEKERALLEVQEKKLQIEVLKVQIKLGRQICYTPANEHSSGNENSGQCQYIPSTKQTEKQRQGNTSPLHTSTNQKKQSGNVHIFDEDINDENLENVQQFDKNRLKLDERHVTPFTLDTDGTYTNEYHIRSPKYGESLEPAEIVRFGGENGRNRTKWSSSAPISQHDSDFIPFEVEGPTNFGTNFSNVTDGNGIRGRSHSLPWNSYVKRNHFGRGSSSFRFSNYRHWKSNQWKNRRGRFPGRFQHVRPIPRNFTNDHDDRASKKRKSDDFDRDHDADLRDKLQCSSSNNKEPSCSTNPPTAVKSKSASAEERKPGPTQKSAPAQPRRPNIKNDLDGTALDIERELAKIEDYFCLLEGRPESPVKKLRETKNFEEDDDDSDSWFSEIYHVIESTGSSERDETEKRSLKRSSRANLEAFPTPPRETEPADLTSSIDGNNECRPFAGNSKKVNINFKRLDKNRKSVPNPGGLTCSMDGNNECKPLADNSKKVHINLKRLDKSKKPVPFIKKK